MDTYLCIWSIFWICVLLYRLRKEEAWRKRAIVQMEEMQRLLNENSARNEALLSAVDSLERDVASILDPVGH